MTEERKIIEIPEITRVEGHSAVVVDIENGKVRDVKLNVFEGTRFFEKIVVGHHYSEMPHITSRVCAICSTGHVLAAVRAVECALDYTPNETESLCRELMHLGMIIESHATHIYALALPDFVGAGTVFELATQHPERFKEWTELRSLGASIQTIVGGRPFHPVAFQVGGMSTFPNINSLADLLPKIEECLPMAVGIFKVLNAQKVNLTRTTQPEYAALIPHSKEYSYFGDHIQSSEGWTAPVTEYRTYLNERSVPYSHAKRSQARGKPLMVGSMARLHLFGSRLPSHARDLYASSKLSTGAFDTLLNNEAQAIEVVAALERTMEIIGSLRRLIPQSAHDQSRAPAPAHARQQLNEARIAVGAVECPRGTLYHSYGLSRDGKITEADMITPSAQNTARIELDIREAVDSCADPSAPELQSGLETLVRAYDPCNTCATHMVKISYKR